ncbi:MAG TPA: 16S rRNA (guanine(527)-N(7))-methyltransferase RsmG [Thermoleophilaceae bacterium]|nr:16S rRNA (guanine(527)-N(7))-methyltransferase RsmG [Thermoleophilaceae bacterium]
MTLRDRLKALAAEYHLPPPAPDQLARLLEALAAEDDPHTTITEPARAIDQHIADSLSGLHVPALREADSIVDIGAGAGFPGLPLAIALPGARVDLVEAARRKCAVIERLAAAASATNARALPLRSEDWAQADGCGAYDLATARAVAPLAALVEYAAPLLRPGGTFIAWKGARDAAEETAGADAAEIVGLRTADIIKVRPYTGARDLNLHLYLKERPTPSRFPRRPGMAAKRPLA